MTALMMFGLKLVSRVDIYIQKCKESKSYA